MSNKSKGKMKPVYACTRSWSSRPDDVIKKGEEGDILSQHTDDVFLAVPSDREFNNRLFVVLVQLAETICSLMNSIVQTLNVLSLLPKSLVF